MALNDDGDARLAALHQWLRQLPADLALAPDSLRPASADASFRRYFRIDAAARFGGSLIVMDAPPARENCRAYVRVAALLHEAGLHAPRIVADDLVQGFLLLTDLGQATYLAALRATQAQTDAGSVRRAHELMTDAIAALVRWQGASRAGVLPVYDRAFLQRELDLFPEWYVARHLEHQLRPAQMATLHDVFALIITSALAQPSVYMHRDFMPRNLMVSDPNPGVLDFQDAVFGPISYDIASLLRDAFISWDETHELDWAIRYWDAARTANLPVPADFGDFFRALEWMGLQRHLKVLGIFARINYRDGKPDYLADTPRFVHYVRRVTQRYSALAPLARLFDEFDEFDGSDEFDDSAGPGKADQLDRGAPKSGAPS